MRDKEKITLSLRDSQNNAVQLQSRHCEMEMKLEKTIDHLKKDLEQKEHRHDYEVDKINKVIHGKCNHCVNSFENQSFLYIPFFSFFLQP